MGKATMQEIADSCQVSLKTVSRVLNHSDQVTDKTRRRVEEAMEQMGYRVNLARGLKQNQTNILVIFLDHHQEEYLNAWRNEMLKALFRQGRKQGQKLIMAPSDNQGFQDDETDGFNLLASGIADGAILMEYFAQDSRVSYLKKNGIPYVILGQTKDESLCAVSMDHGQLGFEGGRAMAKRGYKKPCLLTENKEALSSRLLRQGFEQALAGWGIEGLVLSGATDIRLAYERTKEALLQGADCFFAPGDERMGGVCRAVREKGRKIPQEAGLLGFSDFAANAYREPPLTAFCQDFDRLAEEALLRLKAQRDPGKDGVPENRFFPSALVERASIRKEYGITPGEDGQAKE